MYAVGNHQVIHYFKGNKVSKKSVVDLYVKKRGFMTNKEIKLSFVDISNKNRTYTLIRSYKYRITKHSIYTSISVFIDFR